MVLLVAGRPFLGVGRVRIFNDMWVKGWVILVRQRKRDNEKPRAKQRLRDGIKPRQFVAMKSVAGESAIPSMNLLLWKQL